MDKEKLAELALDIFESISGFVLADEDGRILYINRILAEKLGRKPEEIIGKPVEKIMTHSQMQEMIARAKCGESVPPETVFSSILDAIRSRIVVYRDGEAGAGNVRGVMAFDVLNSKDGARSQSCLLGSVERMFLNNEMYREHLAQVYTANRDPDEILGASHNVRAMQSLIRKVAPSTATVCILGETGTGKELVANAIHKLSRRADKPFVKINCAAIPKDLMESELFGYEPGAFTGASRHGKLGKFEIANGGTLLLDEIGEMPVNLQAKLLRVLQEGEVERVGGTSSIPIDVRLLCSTNRNLQEMVEKGEFRADLYYRINTMEVRVPPLRVRKEDIPTLAAHFIEECNEKNNLSITGLAPGTSRVLLSYDWPGNVRELENIIERACILCGSGQLEVWHFSALINVKGKRPENRAEPIPSLSPENTVSSGIPTHTEPAHKPRFAERERQKLLDVLDDCGGNLTAAARHLGIARSTLYAKLKKYRIKKEEIMPIP